MGAYDRLHVNNSGKIIKSGGHTINRRTYVLFHQAKDIYALIGGTGDIAIYQGSYNRGVTQSAGTHDGGGAIDSGPVKKTASNWNKWEKAQRICGLGSYDRPDLPGHWSHHNHTIYRGDKEMSGSLRRQDQDFVLGLNALASHRRETGRWRPGVVFVPSYPLGRVDLSNMIRESRKTKGYIAMPGVKKIQTALNLKMHAGLKVDGIYGKATKKQFSRWETSMGFTPDGIPGHLALACLGGGRFNVFP